MRYSAIATLLMLIFFQSLTQARTNEGIARVGFTYLPTGTMKMPADVEGRTFYDSFALRIDLSYAVSDYLEIGPGIEFINKKVNPDATFSSKISVISALADARFSYPMTDSGSSNFVVGLGTGVCKLTEKGSGSATGPNIYGIIGFDIGLGKDMGLDLLLRYGFARAELENIREYRYNGWALQTGLNYRFRL
jgi:hypothetical protein